MGWLQKDFWTNSAFMDTCDKYTVQDHSNIKSEVSTAIWKTTLICNREITADVNWTCGIFRSGATSPLLWPCVLSVKSSKETGLGNKLKFMYWTWIIWRCTVKIKWNHFFFLSNIKDFIEKIHFKVWFKCGKNVLFKEKIKSRSSTRHQTQTYYPKSNLDLLPDIKSRPSTRNQTQTYYLESNPDLLPGI